MSFAVVGILGHFSKTLLLFFIPQVFNFLYSVPQIFHFIPCPRHRLPKYNRDTDLLECSNTQFRYSELGLLGKLFVRIFKCLRIIRWNEDKTGIVTTNNFTIINLTIVLCGPKHENQLTKYLLGVQVLCTCIAFIIRYPLAIYFYEYWCKTLSNELWLGLKNMKNKICLNRNLERNYFDSKNCVL